MPVVYERIYERDELKPKFLVMKNNKVVKVVKGHIEFGDYPDCEIVVPPMNRYFDDYQDIRVGDEMIDGTFHRPIITGMRRTLKNLLDFLAAL